MAVCEANVGHERAFQKCMACGGPPRASPMRPNMLHYCFYHILAS